MNTHVMVDIETLGTACDAPILSIGAVAFDIESGYISAKFYRAVDPSSALEDARADGATLRWWMAQSDAARSAAFSGGSLISEALAAFDEGNSLALVPLALLQSLDTIYRQARGE